MTIIEYRGSTRPRDIIARLKQRNRKDELARAIYLIWQDAYAQEKTDLEIITEIRKHLSGVI